LPAILQRVLFSSPTSAPRQPGRGGLCHADESGHPRLSYPRASQQSDACEGIGGKAGSAENQGNSLLRRETSGHEQTYSQNVLAPNRPRTFAHARQLTVSYAWRAARRLSELYGSDARSSSGTGRRSPRQRQPDIPNVTARAVSLVVAHILAVDSDPRDQPPISIDVSHLDCGVFAECQVRA
jgi:hypothetical protein